MIAKAFLSHSSTDKDLVHAVSKELGRRGVISWVDVHQLPIGAGLVEELPMAIEAQTAFVIFISSEALKSDWVNLELKKALDLETDRRNWILPVFLDNPKRLVKSNALLKEKWMNQGRFNRVCIFVDTNTGSSVQDQAVTIADLLAKSMYRLIGMKTEPEINVVIDQRGDGPRTDDYPLPSEVAGFPTLVFRPDNGDRSHSQTQIDTEFTSFAEAIKQALARALGNTLSEKKIHILGKFQLGLAFELGKYLNRTTGVFLYCHDRFQDQRNDFTSECIPSVAILSGGDSHCEREIIQNNRPLSVKIEDDMPHPHLALYIGKQDYVKAVYDHVQTGDKIPLLFVQSLEPGTLFTSPDQVTTLIKNVVALLFRLHSHNNTWTVMFYCDLPVTVLILLVSETVFLPNIRFMEFRRDLGHPQGEEAYTALVGCSFG